MPITTATRHSHSPQVPPRRWHHRALKIVAPPISHRLHRTYDGWHWMHLLIDTMLAAVILGLVALNAGVITFERRLEPPRVALTITSSPHTTAEGFLDISLNITNNSNQPIHDLVLSNTFPSQVHVRSSVPASNGSGNRWRFERLNPQRSTGIIIRGLIVEHVLIPARAKAELQYQHAGRRHSASATLELPLPSINAVVFRSEGLYASASGVQIGYGPIPPRVGQATGYRIVWTVIDVADYHSLVVTSQLPPGSSWKGNPNATAGTAPFYDPESRSVTWQLMAIDQAAGTISAGFDVALTPAATDRGRRPLLLETAVLQLTRADGTTVEVRADPVTTKLTQHTGDEQSVVVE